MTKRVPILIDDAPNELPGEFRRLVAASVIYGRVPTQPGLFAVLEGLWYPRSHDPFAESPGGVEG